MNTIDITPILNAAIALMGAVITAFLIPWIQSKTSAAQREDLMGWAKIGVAAAEQLFVGQGRGKEKKAAVLEFLKDNGFTVNMDSVNNAIEAAVKLLNAGELSI